MVNETTESTSISEFHPFSSGGEVVALARVKSVKDEESGEFFCDNLDLRREDGIHSVCHLLDLAEGRDRFHKGFSEYAFKILEELISQAKAKAPEP